MTRSERGFTLVEVLIAVVVLGIGVVALAGSLIGWLTVRIGPRYVLVAGSLLMGAGLVGAGSMHSLIHWYALAVGIGVAVACLGDLPTGAAPAAGQDPVAPLLQVPGRQPLPFFAQPEPVPGHSSRWRPSTARSRGPS